MQMTENSFPFKHLNLFKPSKEIENEMKFIEDRLWWLLHIEWLRKIADRYTPYGLEGNYFSLPFLVVENNRIFQN